MVAVKKMLVNVDSSREAMETVKSEMIMGMRCLPLDSKNLLLVRIVDIATIFITVRDSAVIWIFPEIWKKPNARSWNSRLG